MSRFGLFLFIVGAFTASRVEAQQDRLSIGISQIEDSTQTGVPDAFASMIESALTATGRFRVIERARLDALLNPPPARPSRRRRTRPEPTPAPPVDYLVRVTIVSVGARNRTNIGTSLLGGVMSGLGLGGGETRCANQEATIALDIRIVHAATREVRHVLRIDETQRASAVCSGETEIDAPRLFRAAANRVSAELVTSIYPIQVAAVQPDGVLILNYGTGTVLPNAVYAVYIAGVPIRDPGTGRTIGNSETRLGYVRVSEVTSQMSRARPIGSFAPSVGAILRPATRDEVRLHEREESQRRRQRRRTNASNN